MPRTPGFVTDFVASLRGNEVPVAFSSWCAILALSSALKRETWYRWHPERLYPNFYLILVGPAGEAKKGVAIGQFSAVLQGMTEYITAYNVRVMKEMKVFEDKITSEGLAKFLKTYLRGSVIPLLDSEGKVLMRDGHPVTYKKTAELTIVAEELGTLMSKARYNEDLITNLTALYNTKSRGSELTVKRGKVEMPNLFTNLIGGTTPDAFRESIPRAALNEGFLSRTIVCYQKACVQCYPDPISFGPKREELSSRLAWIAENTVGEWRLSPEAKKLYDAWYERNKKAFDFTRFHSSQRSRFSIHLLKLALILSAQRYVVHRKEETRVIDLEALEDAINLLEATMETAPAVIEEVEASALGRLEHRIHNYLLEHPTGATRTRLMQNQHLTAQEVTTVISDMFNGGKIGILRDGKKSKDPPAHKNGEVYYALKIKDEA